MPFQSSSRFGNAPNALNLSPAPQVATQHLATGIHSCSLPPMAPHKPPSPPPVTTIHASGLIRRRDFFTITRTGSSPPVSPAAMAGAAMKRPGACKSAGELWASRRTPGVSRLRGKCKIRSYRFGSGFMAGFHQVGTSNLTRAWPGFSAISHIRRCAYK